MAKVSLILPSLNVHRYIDECLQSVVSQTLRDIEIICVDAGSTDGTLEIIRNYQKKDNRIHLYISEKKSYGYQMNLGFDNSSGEYIGIVETDDWVPANMYEDLYKLATLNKVDVLKADFYRFITNGNELVRYYNAIDPSCLYYGQVLNPKEVPSIFRCTMNTWSGIYRRDFLKINNIRHNESPGASYQDTGFWFQTFCCASRVLFFNKPYYMNRRDNESSSVFNRGNIYAMTEEWHYIYDWLKLDSSRFQTFIGVYTLRFYHSLLFTYQRIAPEYRNVFIDHMSNELNKIYEKGNYDRKVFLFYEWKQFNLIRKAPKDYHMIRSFDCRHFIVAKIIKTLNSKYSHSWLIHIICKLDKLANTVELAFSWICYEGLVATIRRLHNKLKSDRIRKDQIDA